MILSSMSYPQRVVLKPMKGQEKKKIDTDKKKIEIGTKKQKVNEDLKKKLKEPYSPRKVPLGTIWFDW